MKTCERCLNVSVAPGLHIFGCPALLHADFVTHANSVFLESPFLLPPLKPCSHPSVSLDLFIYPLHHHNPSSSSRELHNHHFRDFSSYFLISKCFPPFFFFPSRLSLLALLTPLFASHRRAPLTEDSQTTANRKRITQNSFYDCSRPIKTT